VGGVDGPGHHLTRGLGYGDKSLSTSHQKVVNVKVSTPKSDTLVSV
jgi:hypothetical protein